MNCMRSLRLLLLPALLSACSDSGSTLYVSLNALTDSDLGTVTVSVDHPDGRATFNIDDFAIAPGSTILHVGPFRVPDDGEASVVVTYTDPQGVVFEAKGTWALRRHFAWSLGVAGVAPDACMGCRATWRFLVTAGQPYPPRSFWLLLGGTEIGSDVVY